MQFPRTMLEGLGFKSSVCLSHFVSFSPAICFLSFKELYQPSAESLRQQEELKQLYQRQQEKGGIIDLEAERNRYFISLQQVRKGKGSPFWPQMPPTFL